MSPERWQQISRIFKSALSLDGRERSAYVSSQCGSDDALRAEVEKLIASHQLADGENFMGGRAAEDGAALLTDQLKIKETASNLLTGRVLGSYVVLDKLGSGGMGEVYLARDSRLDRTVALKVLARDIATDQQRMRRFRHEAKLASSLNQPNILTIFEFGQVDELTFLVTEFIDGETLRNYLHGKRRKLPEILDVAIQVLAALDAAHEARIVHRDIKPENVMIRRRDRIVKVLDFGLAKVTERGAPLRKSHESDLESITELKTAPGILMGTINYMSPEQAQAHPVDERTDIWSTGVLLYEMVTGVMPFGGPTTSHTLVQIIDQEPAPLTKAGRETPPELQRIIRKAMAKRVEDRYQTARDMLIDLRNLRQQLAGGVTDGTDRGAGKKRVLVFALMAMLVVTAAFLAFAVWRAKRVAAPASPPVAVAAGRVLTYWITVQQFRNGKYEKSYPVAGEINFESADQIRLNVRSPQDGYFYVLNEGPRQGALTSEFVVLFPSPTTNNGVSHVQAAQTFQIPEHTWLQFDAQQGVERLWLIFAEAAVPELEALQEFANPQTRGLISDVSRNRALQAFLAANSNAKPELDKGDELTTLKTPGKLLVYAVRLEHH